MPRFAANIDFLFAEYPRADRFAAAAACGFRGVEMLFPYALPADTLARRIGEAGLETVLINMPAGDWAAGDRGLAALPGREDEFERALDRACDYLAALDCPRLHVLAGIVPPGADRARHRETYLDNLGLAAARVAPLGATVTVEPINPRDIPGYFLTHPAQAKEIVDAVGAANLGLQLDLYHCQIVAGDLTRHIRDLAPVLRHIQIAGVPDRHEPDIGEVHYPPLFEAIDNSGYDGWVGCEYRPRTTTVDGLGWLKPFL